MLPDFIHLTPDRAAWLPDERALVVADVHVGYARAARRRGGWLPGEAESPARLAERLLAAAARVGARRLVVAGDLRHSTRDVDAAELREVEELLARLRDALDEVLLVAGNHDRGAGDMHATLALGAVEVTHEPPGAEPARWTVCGHLHPSTELRDETGAALRVPCALVGPRTVILPAFTDWAGGTRASRLVRGLGWGSWTRYAMGGERVWPV